MGIILPSNNNYGGENIKDANSIPTRLYKNFKNNFIKIYDWSNTMPLEEMIHNAFESRYAKNPDNSDPLRRRNSN